MSALSSAGQKPGDTCPPHAVFEVVKVDAGQALKLVRHDPNAVYDDGHHCWTNKVAFTDGTLSARVMAEDTMKGHCGIAFRIKDQKNYYAIRYSVVEGNFSMVRVKNGIPVWGPVKVSTGDIKGSNKWFDLKINVAGSTITAFLNEKQVFQHTDADPLAGPGGVGLFSRGEQSIVLWDDFKVELK